MVVKMVVYLCSLALFIVGSNADGEFDVIHIPKSLKFTGSSRMPETLLKEVFSASLGMTVDEDIESEDWEGLTILDPFALPEAVVEIFVDGVTSLGETLGHKVQLEVDEYETDTFEQVQHRIQQRFPSGGNNLHKILLSDVNQVSSGDFANIKVAKMSLSNLKYSWSYAVEEDRAYLNELATLKAITDKVNSGIISGDNIIDFYNFHFQALHALSDFHGPNSVQVKEAKSLLCKAIGELSAAFTKAYDGSVLVAAVATEVAHARRVARAAVHLRDGENTETTALSANDDTTVPSENADTTVPSDNADTTVPSDNATPEPAPATPQPQESLAADSNSEDYAAIFNIILWFGIAFAFSLIAIIYAIMDMDPGRDTVIYRMTTPRIKKDN